MSIELTLDVSPLELQLLKVVALQAEMHRRYELEGRTDLVHATGRHLDSAIAAWRKVFDEERGGKKTCPE